MATKDPIDLAQLADDYDILGALAGREDAQVALATRKADNQPVLISIVREPAGDQGNALSHLASDANILSSSPHPAIIPVLANRWIGNDALALVTARVSAPSLEDLLLRREEGFPFPRIATILRELNGVLSWARERGVVNRTLHTDSVFVEEGSDAVKVRFTAGALAANGIPDEQDDARTIASLARAMMTRSAADPERDAMPLAELRPGLPSRVVQQTEALLGKADSLEPVDVRAYIAAIAMAEELKSGEDECVRVTREMGEEQRVTREQLAAERKAHEDDLAEQARKFAQEREQILKEMSKEREEAARALARERETGAKQLRQEREEMEKRVRQERERLEKEAQKQSDLLSKERARLARERKAFEREAEKQRALIAERLAALQAQAELYGRTAEMPAALLEPLPAPEPIEEEPVIEIPIRLSRENDEEPLLPTPVAVREPARPAGPGWSARFANDRRWRRGGLVALALLLVAAIGALALGRRSGDPDVAAPVAAVGTPNTIVVDSLAGVTVPPPVDSMAATVAVPDSTPGPRPRPRPAPRRQAAVARDTVAPSADPFVVQDPVQPVLPVPLSRTDSTVRSDTGARRDTVVRRDTSVRRDTLVQPRRDTTPPVRPDTIPGASR